MGDLVHNKDVISKKVEVANVTEKNQTVGNHDAVNSQDQRKESKVAGAISQHRSGLKSSIGGPGLSAEMTGLRRKYDVVVAFTVALMQEKDVLKRKLAHVRLELKQELSTTMQLQGKKGTMHGWSSTLLASKERMVLPDVGQAREVKLQRAPAGYATLRVVFAGVLAFCLGRLL